MKKLNVAFCSFPDYSSNAKPLYMYMVKKYKDHMNFSWIVRSEKMYNSLKKMGIDVYILGASDYYEHIKTVDVIFSTHGDIINDKPDGSLYIELWHGIASKIIGYLSGDFSEFDKQWYNVFKKKIDYMIVPSSFWKVVFSCLFNIDCSRILPLGYPKLDNLMDNDCVNKLNKVLNIDTRKYRKIIYYMPTYRKGCDRLDSFVNEKNIFNVDIYPENELISFLEKNNYLLCIKKHPSEQFRFPDVKSSNIHVITDDSLLENEITINEILNASDLLITDYSSLGIEYTFLNKPVIYLIRDIEEYNIKRGVIFDNYSFWMPGPKVSNFMELKHSINDCLKSDNIINDEYISKRNLWFGNLSDGGCKQICDFIFDKNLISKNINYYVDSEEKLEVENSNLREQVENLSAEISSKQNELDLVLNSKGWKLLESFRKIRNKIIKK